MKCGFSKKCITPPNDSPIAGGYEPKYSIGVIDDLYVRAIAFSYSDTRALVVAVDICYMATEIFDECRTRIAKACGMDRDSIIITCSHTHAGPHVGGGDLTTMKHMPKYVDELKSSIVSAAVEAFGDLTPSKFYTAKGEAKGVSFIRRYMMRDGSVATNPGIHNPDILYPLGEPNETVKLLKIERENKKDVYIVNFGTHACMVGGYRISADYPGVVCSTVEGAIGDCDCVFVVSAQGDTNHVNVNSTPEELRLRDDDLENSSVNRCRAKHLGRSIAGVAISLSMIAREISAHSLSFGTKEIAIPSNKDDGSVEEARKISKLHKEGRASELPYSGMALTTVIANANRIIRMQTAPDFYTYNIYAISIGDFVFVGLPGEPFTEIGNRVCDASPFDETMLCCVSNCMSTYFPTSKAMREGGYEAVTSNIGIGADDVIVEGSKALMMKLKKK